MTRASVSCYWRRTPRFRPAPAPPPGRSAHQSQTRDLQWSTAAIGRQCSAGEAILGFTGKTVCASCCAPADLRSARRVCSAPRVVFAAEPPALEWNSPTVARMACGWPHLIMAVFIMAVSRQHDSRLHRTPAITAAIAVQCIKPCDQGDASPAPPPGRYACCRPPRCGRAQIQGFAAHNKMSQICNRCQVMLGMAPHMHQHMHHHRLQLGSHAWSLGGAFHNGLTPSARF